MWIWGCISRKDRYHEKVAPEGGKADSGERLVRGDEHRVIYYAGRNCEKLNKVWSTDKRKGGGSSDLWNRPKQGLTLNKNEEGMKVGPAEMAFRKEEQGMFVVTTSGEGKQRTLAP